MPIVLMYTYNLHHDKSNKKYLVYIQLDRISGHKTCLGQRPKLLTAGITS